MASAGLSVGFVMSPSGIACADVDVAWKMGCIKCTRFLDAESMGDAQCVPPFITASSLAVHTLGSIYGNSTKLHCENCLLSLDWLGTV